MKSSFWRQLLFYFSLFIFGVVGLKTNAYAQSVCSATGYTVLTINGIFTNQDGAKTNSFVLKRKLSENGTFNNEPLIIDYLYNPTHVAGLGDLIDAAQQGVFEQKSDYDLVEMLDDASQKVKTQKLLLVAHSQGNFYANNLYDKTADKEGGVPGRSIGVYGVATPTSRVSGGGMYLTSDTDNVIASTVARYINILTPNIHIPLQKSDGNGHSFSDVYLKYQSGRVVSDIRSSLDRLEENDEQLSGEPCISPPKLSFLHKTQGVALAVVDPTAKVAKTIAVTSAVNTYKTGVVVAKTAKTVVVVTAVVTYKAGKATVNATKKAAKAIASTVSTLAGAVFDNLNNLAMNNPAAVVVGSDQASEPSENPTDDEVAGTEDRNSPEKPKTKPQASPGVAMTGSASLVLEDTKRISPVTFAVSHNRRGGGGGLIVAATPDTSPPVISRTGNQSITINVGTAYQDVGATALDDIDGNVTANIVTINPVNVNSVSDYTIRYNVTDAAGNHAIEVTRVVHVVAVPPPPPPPPRDIEAPVITVTGDNPVTITTGGTYTDGGATALDDRDRAVAVSTSGLVDTNTVGAYTITYTARDAAGNMANKTRIVNVVPSNVLYSQLDNGTEINSSSISSFELFTGKTGHIQNLKFAYNDHGNSAGHFIGVSVVDLTTGVNYYGVEEGGGCGNTYESTGADTKVVVELDSSIHYKEYPCTGPDLVLNPTHSYGVALFRNKGGKDTQKFYGSMDSNNSVYLNITDDILPSTGKAIKKFDFPELGASGVIDENNKSVEITVPFGADITKLMPTVKISGGASISPAASELVDFTNPVTYTITAENGLTEEYTVTVLVHSNVIYSQPDNSVEITGGTNVVLPPSLFSAIGNISKIKFSYNDHGSSGGYSIGVQIVDQTVLRSYYSTKKGMSCGRAYDSTGVNAPIIVTLDETFEYKEYPCTGPNLVFDPTHLYRVNIFQNTGWSDAPRFYGSSNLGSNAYFYIESNGIATATDPIVLSSSKAITAFNFSGLSPEVTGVIDEASHTISLTVPAGTDVTALSPSISISSNASVSPLSGTLQDFTSPVTYTITAENNSTQNYIVTVTISSAPGPSLVSAEVTSANTVDLTFSEDLDGRTVTNADFSITDHTLTTPDASEVSPGVVRLTISDTFASGDTPEIIYNTTVSNGVKDLDGNTVPAGTVRATTAI